MWFDYNTTSHYGVIQCEWYDHAWEHLCLNPNSAYVGVETFNPAYNLDVRNIR